MDQPSPRIPGLGLGMRMISEDFANVFFTPAATSAGTSEQEVTWAATPTAPDAPAAEHVSSPTNVDDLGSGAAACTVVPLTRNKSTDLADMTAESDMPPDLCRFKSEDLPPGLFRFKSEDLQQAGLLRYRSEELPLCLSLTRGRSEMFSSLLPPADASTPVVAPMQAPSMMTPTMHHMSSVCLSPISQMLTTHHHNHHTMHHHTMAMHHPTMHHHMVQRIAPIPEEQPGQCSEPELREQYLSSLPSPASRRCAAPPTAESCVSATVEECDEDDDGNDEASSSSSSSEDAHVSSEAETKRMSLRQPSKASKRRKSDDEDEESDEDYMPGKSCFGGCSRSHTNKKAKKCSSSSHHSSGGGKYAHSNRGAHVKGRPEMQETARRGQEHWAREVQDLRELWSQVGCAQVNLAFPSQLELMTRRHIKNQHECLLRALHIATARGFLRPHNFNTAEGKSFLGWTGFDILPERAREFRQMIERMFPAPLLENTLHNTFRRAGLVPSSWGEAWLGLVPFMYKKPSS
jgi:hypothetical protein